MKFAEETTSVQTLTTAGMLVLQTEKVKLSNAYPCTLKMKAHSLDGKYLSLYFCRQSEGFTNLTRSTVNITYKDWIRNGQYCKSGLAFPIFNSTGYASLAANCTAVDHIVFNGIWLNDSLPYSCDPTNQSNKCVLVYNASYPNPGLNATYANFSTNCECALTGDDGYCGRLLGTANHAGWVELIKTVLEANTCHTLDRLDIRAWRDSCGNLPTGDIDNAVDALFSKPPTPD